MSQREKTYNHTIRTSKSRLRYRNYRRRHRREVNKLKDVSTIEGMSMPIRADGKSPQNHNQTPQGGQVRVTYDEHLPFSPLPHEVKAENAGIANGMLPIIQTDADVQPIPYGTKMRIQNHGGKGGPAQGNFKKMRPVGFDATPDAAYVQVSFEGNEKQMASAAWGGASVMAAVADFLGLTPEKEEPPPATPSDPVLTIEQLQAKYEGVETKTLPDGKVLEGEYITEDGKMFFEYKTSMLGSKQRLGVYK